MQRVSGVVTSFFSKRSRGFKFPCPVAVRIGAAGPEGFAGVDAFLRHPLEHRLAAFGAERCVLGEALFRAELEPLVAERFGETALLRERLQAGFELLIEHQDEPVAEDEDTTCYGQRIVAFQPLVELLFLREDMEAALVEHVVVVRYFIELNRLYLLELRLVNRPRRLLVLEQPVGVVVGEFGKAGTRDIDEFHFGLAGRVMARRSFGDIGGAGAGGLRHLVVLASARVVLQVEEPPAEILRRELNDVREDPGVEPVIGQRADFHKAIMFLEVKVFFL